MFLIKAKGDVILDNDNNKKVKREKQELGGKTFISEVQEFDRPMDYEEAFKKYYPKQK